MTDTKLSKEKILTAWDRFKKLAGPKGFVAINDLKSIIGEELYRNVCRIFSNDNGQIDFK